MRPRNRSRSRRGREGSQEKKRARPGARLAAAIRDRTKISSRTGEGRRSPTGRRRRRRSVSSSSSGSGAGDAGRRHRRLLRAHQRTPGALAQQVLEDMTELLGQRTIAEREPFQPIATTFLLTVLFNLHHPREIGVRAERELRTLCMAIDCILRGEPEAGLDVLAQRVKAIERSVTDQGWQTARWLELIPTGSSLLVRRDEARAAIAESTAEERVARRSTRAALAQGPSNPAWGPQRQERGSAPTQLPREPAWQGGRWKPKKQGPRA